MAFGHSSLPTRKYAYGAREFLPRDPAGDDSPRVRFEGHDAAVEQLRAAHCFQNKLVEIERARRAAADRALSDLFPDLAALLSEAEAAGAVLRDLRDQISAANVRNRSRVSDADLVAQADAQRRATEAAWGAFSARRREAFRDPSARPALDAVDEEHGQLTGAARTAAVAGAADRNGRPLAPLYWATSLQVCQRVKKSGPPPRFKSWDGDGVLSVQFQRKPDRSSPKVPVCNPDGTPRIHPRSGRPMTRHERGGSMSTAAVRTPNSLCWVESRGRCENGREYVTVHFRIGSSPNGEPVWARVPAVFHRPLPEGEVKWAHLSRRRVGTHYKWEVLFDVARPEWDSHPAGDERATSGTVAVALGWRRVSDYGQDEVRVAEWVGDDGASGTVRLPEELVRDWERLERLQSVRDRLFDELHGALCEWLRVQPALPDEWRRRTENIAQWNSPRRLASLVWWWRDNRLPGDEEIYRKLEGELVRAERPARDHYTGGRKQDKHLCDWQAHLRARLLAARKDFYRKVAIDLSRQYKEVIVAEIDWHEIAANPEPEEADELVRKRFRGLSACASFRDCLTHYMDEVRARAEGIVVTCHACGGGMRDPGAGRWVRCERCGGERMDRAVNAANNLLQRGLATQTAT